MFVAARAVVVPDGRRTTHTNLGACASFNEADVAEALVADAEVTYLEGTVRRAAASAGAYAERRRNSPRPTTAVPNINRVAGSGIASPVRENVALKVGNGVPPTMSCPTLSQSGSRAASRVQLCKSVNPAGNGVPGAAIGLGADSHRKSPLLSSTWGTKK